MAIIFAQIFRLISAFFYLAGDRSNNKKKIFTFNAVYNFFSGIQYLLLNAITGALCSFLAILRNVFLFRFGKRVPLWIFISYLLIVLGLNLLVYDGLITILPFFLVLFYSIALYIGKVKYIKYSIIITCLLEIIYDIYYLAYVGIIVSIIDIILVIISLKKLKKGKQSN
jgi:sulfite exporter TauE/SafE